MKRKLSPAKLRVPNLLELSLINWNISFNMNLKSNELLNKKRKRMEWQIHKKLARLLLQKHNTKRNPDRTLMYYQTKPIKTSLNL